MSDLDKALAAALDAAPCVCGEPTLGVVHRADGPCYLPEQAPPAAAVPSSARGYTDDDRKRIVSDMQSMRDRLGGFLVRTYGDQFDGDIDTMLDAINFMKALRLEKPAALAEPLFLLHTGAVYGNERGDWEVEANSGKAVDAYCDANPGKTVGLYLATPTQRPAAAVQKGYALVPAEPTPEMIAAGWFGGEMHIALGHANAYRECEGDYARLLAAALAGREGES